MSEEIKRLIPHRPPFLFVDRIVSIEKNIINTEKIIKGDESFFSGHYPNNPIMPGVLICEAIFQSGAILISKILGNSTDSAIDSDKVPVLTRIKNVKFKNMVKPGDVLQLKVELIEKIGGAFFMNGSAKANDKVAVSAEFAITTTIAE